MERDEIDAEKEVKRVRAMFRRAFSTDSGTGVLEHLKKTYVMTSARVRGDSHEAAYREGRRDLVLELLSLAEPEP